MLPLVLAIRFALELTLLAAFGWWGHHVAGVLGAVACVVGVAVVWGLFLSPKARVPLSAGIRATVEIAVFVAAAAGLAALGNPLWGVALVAADVLNLLALRGLGATTGGGPVA